MPTPPREEPRKSRGAGAESERDRLAATMLDLVGEVGYRRAGLAELLSRSGVGRPTFDRNFAGTAECFALAHREATARLLDRLLAADRAAPRGDDRRGLLTELLSFAEGRPGLARALLVEVHVAGGEALAAYGALLAGLAVDLTSPGGSGLPADFLVGAVEGFLRARLASRETEDLGDALPDLEELVRASCRPGPGMGRAPGRA